MPDRTEKSRTTAAAPPHADLPGVALPRIAIPRIAIQGERGSNSHMAALEMLGPVVGPIFGPVEVEPCASSQDVVDAVLAGRVDGAVLPIENSLHGSVAEHYDLLLAHPLRIERESLFRVRHNLIVAPGVRLEDVRQVLSHPVALSQCRNYLATLKAARAVPFYDTAGSVKHILAEGLRDTAGISPVLAAEEYGGEVLVKGIEDHAENFTRFHLLRRADAFPAPDTSDADKLSVAFAVEHRPGTLVAALARLAQAGVDLMKIESRPVPGRPWEYVFYADFRFSGEAMAEAALAGLRQECGMVKELGRYRAA